MTADAFLDSDSPAAPKDSAADAFLDAPTSQAVAADDFLDAPQSVEDVERLTYAPGSTYLPTEDEVTRLRASREAASKARSLSSKVGGAVKAVGQGFVGAGQMIGTQAGKASVELEGADARGTPTERLKQIGSTAAEAGAQALAQVRSPMRKFMDYLGRSTLGQTVQSIAEDTHGIPEAERESFSKGAESKQYYKDFIDRLQEDRALQAAQEGETTLLGLPGTLPGVAALGSNVVDPTLAAGAAEKVLPAAIERAVASVPSQLAKKVAQGGVKGVEAVGRAVKAAGELPENLIEGATGKILGSEAAEKAGKAIKQSAAAQIALTPAKALAKAGEAVESGAAFAGKVLGKEESQVPRLLQLAQDKDAPKWMRVLASGLDKAGVEQGARMVGDLAKGGAKGAAVGAALVAPGAETPEEIGSGAGAGIYFGTAGGISELPHLKSERVYHQKLADLKTFAAHLEANGTPENVVKKISDDAALIASGALHADVMQAATAHAVSGKKLNFRFLEEAGYNQENPTGKGTAAVFNPDTSTISVNVDANGKALTHELGHAILKATGADAEARLKIDSILSPEEVTKQGRDYAEKLVRNQIRAGGLDPDTMTPQDYQARIDGTIGALNQLHGGDKWIYDEIYAEAAFGALKDKDLMQVLAPSATDRLLEAIGVTDKPASVPKSALFDNAKIYGPEIRKMVYEHYRRVYREGEKAAVGKETKEGVPKGTPVPAELYGKHPSVPVGSDVIAVENNKVRPATVREIKQAEKARQEVVKGAFEKAPTKPKGDVTPEVAPRITPEGEKEVSGTKISDILAKFPQFSDHARAVAKMVEDVIAAGQGRVIDTWYQAIGRTPGWARDVKKRLGNVAVSKVKLAPFLFRVSKEGNVLIVGLSLTAMERRLAKWADSPSSLLNQRWGGDAEQFRTDLLTYLKNHAEGKPGAEGLNEVKRDALNAFLIGRNAKFEGLNPLRSELTGEDRGGIIRSLRLDRMANPEPLDVSGYQAEYPKKVQNFKPADADVLTPDSTPDEVLESAKSAREGNLIDTEHQLVSNGARQFSPENTKPKEENAPVWFSQLRKVVASNKLPENAPAAQVAAVLRNPQNGIKADELKWTGTDDFLKEKIAKGEKVSRVELLQHLDINGVKVEEVTKGGETAMSKDMQDWLDFQAHRGVRNPTTPSAWASRSETLEKLAQQWKANGDAEKAEKFFKLSEEATSHAESLDLGTGSAAGQPKFSKYQLPGGENYRELLFTLPEKTNADWTPENLPLNLELGGGGLRMVETTQWTANINGSDYTITYNPHQKHYRLDGERGGLMNARFRTLQEAMDRAAKGTDYQHSGRQVFRSTHWDEPNVIAHTRVNDRNDSKGRPGLFAEELQSDWHQKGRKEGYRTSDQSKQQAAYNKLVAEGVPEFEAIRRAQEEFGSGLIPDAPFKNSWHEFVFRRLVREAAETGKDWLGWTTGEQQAERYDLSKQVDKIAASKDGDQYHVNVSPKGATGASSLIRQTMPAGKLADFIGKEMADKIVADTSATEEWVHYSGLDLKVGGEGMKGFYDKILVDYANKFGKKFGAKVSERTVEQHTKAGLKNPWALQFDRHTAGEDAIYDVFPTRAAAGRAMIRLRDVEGLELTVVPNPEHGSVSVHSLDITPEMKKSVLAEGQPMFSPDTSKDEEVQLKGKPLPNSVGSKTIPIIHYSGQPGLTKLSPKFFGKGQATPTDLRGGEKTYAFVEGSDFGQDANIFTKKQAYGATIDGSRIYDLSKGKPDPLGYFSQINREEADDSVKGAGYAGILVDTKDNRKVVMLYRPVKVKALGEGGSEVTKKVKGPQYSPEVETKQGRKAPDEEVRAVAKGYMDEAGLPYTPHTGYEKVNEDYAKSVADAYEAAKHNPDDPAVKASYDAMSKETIDQWNYITSQGVKMEPWTKEGQPYKNSAEMMSDVKENKHLWFFPTDAGYGQTGAEGVGAHPLLAPTGVEVNGRELPVNDLFRAVHDYFGHAKEGYEFGPRGEFNAYLAHAGMYSDAAKPAMAAETLGQNSWVNFGKHLRDDKGNVPKKGAPRYVPQTERPFAEQKATLLPAELTKFSPDDEGEMPMRAGQKLIEVIGPDGKKYPTRFDGYQDMTVLGLGFVPQLTPVDKFPFQGDATRSTTYGPKLSAAGFKLPEDLPSVEQWQAAQESGKGYKTVDVGEKVGLVKEKPLFSPDKRDEDFRTRGSIELTKHTVAGVRKRVLSASVTQNTKKGEKPWRLNWLLEDGKTPGHVDITKQEAKQISEGGKISDRIWEYLSSGYGADPEFKKSNKPLFSPSSDFKTVQVGDKVGLVKELPEQTVARAAGRILALHEKNGGSTFNYADKRSLAGKAAYAVSIYPDRSLILDRPPTKDDLAGFIQDNRDLLKDSDNSVGTWTDSASGKTYVDVSFTTPDRKLAEYAGQKYNQIAVGSLKDLKDIPTGGTGAALQHLAPASDRLRLLNEEFTAQFPHEEQLLSRAVLSPTERRNVRDLAAVAPERDLTKTEGAASNLARKTVKERIQLLDNVEDKVKVRRALQAGVPEVLEYLAKQDKGNFDSGKDWYRKDIEKMEATTKLLFPETKDPNKMGIFKLFLSVLSGGQTPKENFKVASEAFAQYLDTGEMPAHSVNRISETGEAKMLGRNAGQSADKLNSMLARFEGDEKALLDYLSTKHAETEEGHKDAYGAYDIGPKFGRFFLNLTGHADEVTLDLWATRTWHRWLGTPFKRVKDAETGKIKHEMPDAPASDAERNNMIDAFRAIAEDASQRLGQPIDAMDVQAVLWFYEKDLYEKMGVRVDRGLFSHAAEAYAQNPIHKRLTPQVTGGKKTKRIDENQTEFFK